MSVTVADVIRELGLEALGGADDTSGEISGAQVCDLLSHVMSQGRSGQVWITIQTHANIIAVAALAKLAAVIISDDFEPEAETLMRADDEGIPLLATAQKAYVIAGKMYEMGIRR